MAYHALEPSASGSLKSSAPPGSRTPARRSPRCTRAEARPCARRVPQSREGSSHRASSNSLALTRIVAQPQTRCRAPTEWLFGSSATSPSSARSRSPRTSPPVLEMASYRSVPVRERLYQLGPGPWAGGRQPQSVRPTTKPVLSLGPKAATVITRPQAKRPDGSGTAKNWPCPEVSVRLRPERIRRFRHARHVPDPVHRTLLW